MKKIRQATGALLLAASLLACPTAMAAEQQADNAFTYQEVQYYVGMDAGTARRTLGNAVSSRDVNNCASGYVNKAYTYGETRDFEVLIEETEDGREVISNITLLTGKVATEAGLKVGDAESESLKVYPGAKKGLASYTVLLGDSSLYIRTSGGKISFISYL